MTFALTPPVLNTWEPAVRQRRCRHRIVNQLELRTRWVRWTYPVSFSLEDRSYMGISWVHKNIGFHLRSPEFFDPVPMLEV